MENKEKQLVLEIMTKSGSNYKLYKYDGKDETFNILRSDSSAFSDADFILLKNVYIDERLNFIGTVYFNSLIELYEKKYRIISKNKKKDIMTADMGSIQCTTGIESIVVHDFKELDNIIKNNIINIEDKYLDAYNMKITSK